MALWRRASSSIGFGFEDQHEHESEGSRLALMYCDFTRVCPLRYQFTPSPNALLFRSGHELGDCPMRTAGTTDTWGHPPAHSPASSRARRAVLAVRKRRLHLIRGAASPIHSRSGCINHDDYSSRVDLRDDAERAIWVANDGLA